MVTFFIAANFILQLVGSMLCYLAHRNQLLLRRTLPSYAGWLGAVLLFCCFGLWIPQQGAIIALTVSLSVLMMMTTCLPYFAVWLDKQRVPEKRLQTFRRSRQSKKARR